MDLFYSKRPIVWLVLVEGVNKILDRLRLKMSFMIHVISVLLLIQFDFHGSPSLGCSHEVRSSTISRRTMRRIAAKWIERSVYQIGTFTAQQDEQDPVTVLFVLNMMLHPMSCGRRFWVPHNRGNAERTGIYHPSSRAGGRGPDTKLYLYYLPLMSH